MAPSQDITHMLLTSVTSERERVEGGREGGLREGGKEREGGRVEGESRRKMMWDENGKEQTNITPD